MQTPEQNTMEHLPVRESLLRFLSGYLKQKGLGSGHLPSWRRPQGQTGPWPVDEETEEWRLRNAARTVIHDWLPRVLDYTGRGDMAGKIRDASEWGEVRSLLVQASMESPPSLTPDSETAIKASRLAWAVHQRDSSGRDPEGRKAIRAAMAEEAAIAGIALWEASKEAGQEVNIVLEFQQLIEGLDRDSSPG